MEKVLFLRQKPKPVLSSRKKRTPLSKEPVNKDMRDYVYSDDMEQSGGNSKENEDDNITKNIKMYSKMNSGRSSPSRNFPSKNTMAPKTSLGIKKRRKITSLSIKEKSKSKTYKKTVFSKKRSVKSKAATPLPFTSRSSIKHEFGVRKMSYPKFKIKSAGAKKKPVTYKHIERREKELESPETKPRHEKKESLTSRASF